MVVDSGTYQFQFCFLLCKQIDGFKCNKSCPPNYYELDEKCVKACPAGYNASAERPVCVKCQLEKCPKGQWLNHIETI